MHWYEHSIDARAFAPNLRGDVVNYVAVHICQPKIAAGTDRDSAIATVLEFEWRPVRGTRLSLCRWIRERKFFPVILIKLRLGVEGVHMRRHSNGTKQAAPRNVARFNSVGVLWPPRSFMACRNEKCCVLQAIIIGERSERSASRNRTVFAGFPVTKRKSNERKSNERRVDQAKWTAGESNPDLLIANQASSHSTSRPVCRATRTGIEPASARLKASLQNHYCTASCFSAK